MATATTQMLFCLHLCSTSFPSVSQRLKIRIIIARGRPELPLQTQPFALRAPFGSWRFATHADLARSVPQSVPSPHSHSEDPPERPRAATALHIATRSVAMYDREIIDQEVLWFGSKSSAD